MKNIELRAESVGVDLFLEKGIGIEALLTAFKQLGQSVFASKPGVLLITNQSP